MCLINYQKFRGALKFLACFAHDKDNFPKNGKICYKKGLFAFELNFLFSHKPRPCSMGHFFRRKHPRITVVGASMGLVAKCLFLRAT